MLNLNPMIYYYIIQKTIMSGDGVCIVYVFFFFDTVIKVFLN